MFFSFIPFSSHPESFAMRNAQHLMTFVTKVDKAFTQNRPDFLHKHGM
jgi:hypothetical protein